MSELRPNTIAIVRRTIVTLACLLALVLGSTPARAQPEQLSPSVRATLEAGVESSELRELREAEFALFAAGTPAATGVPAITSTLDVAFLAGATLPDIPARWDDAVIQYLQYFRDDPRGRALMRAWYQRGNRYDAAIRATLRENQVPEDLRCVALAESGFNPTARSNVGALGLWQFMPETARQFGMSRDRWVDERMDETLATRGAARYLRDLQRRFGSWELALAAYNMGYGSLLRAIRKYNTNDFSVLARIEAGLPFETTVYVSKIVACGIVLRNPGLFGLNDVERDAPLETALISVPGGTPLTDVAARAGVDEDALANLNPHLLLRVVPASRLAYNVRIPRANLVAYETSRAREPRWSMRTATLRFGERLADVASRYGTNETALREQNRIAPTERVLGPLALAVPNVEPRVVVSSTNVRTVALPAAPPGLHGASRVFYGVLDGDRLDDVAATFDVTSEQIAQWNTLDAQAALQSGMVLQIFTREPVDPESVVLLRPEELHVLVAGTDEFFEWHETQRGRVRTRYRVQTGDTLGAVAARFGITTGDVARINRLPRNGLIRVGQELIVYTSRDTATTQDSPTLTTGSSN